MYIPKENGNNVDQFKPCDYRKYLLLIIVGTTFAVDKIEDINLS